MILIDISNVGMQANKSEVNLFGIIRAEMELCDGFKLQRALIVSVPFISHIRSGQVYSFCMDASYYLRISM